MAAGVPVASFDSASGPREIIEHEVNGLLVGPQSVAGMSAALLRLTTDAELRHRLGQGALRTARQYDAGALAERWIGDLLRGPGPPRQPREADHRRRVEQVVSSAPLATRQRAGRSPRRRPGTRRSRCAVDAARATGADWLVIPPHEHDTTIVVLPMTARDAFLAALVERDPPAYLSLRDPAAQRLARAPRHRPDLGTSLRRGMTAAVCIEPWPEAAACSARAARSRCSSGSARSAASWSARAATPTPTGCPPGWTPSRWRSRASRSRRCR